jgi:hypothetical protein
MEIQQAAQPDGRSIGTINSISSTVFLSPQEMDSRIADNRTPSDSATETSLAIDYLQLYTDLSEEYPDDEQIRKDYKEILAEVRQDFQNFGISVPDDEKAVLDLANNLRNRAEQKASELRPEVESYILDFKHKAIEASLHLGLPLSVEQIEQRLDGIALHFYDILSDSEASGAHLPHRKKIGLLLDYAPDANLRHVLFHEMWHLLSGIRAVDSGIPKGQDSGNDILNSINVKRHGFSYGEERNNKRGKVYDEGIIDLLALAWDKGILINFAAKGEEARLQWQKLYELTGDEQGKMTYVDEAYVVTAMSMGIDADVVFKALLKSDFDELEEDKLAGTHALRDLQRQHKIIGGAKRIKEMRLIDETIGKPSAGNDEAVSAILENAMYADIPPVSLLIHRTNNYNRMNMQRQKGISRARKELGRIRSH